MGSTAAPGDVVRLSADEAGGGEMSVGQLKMLLGEDRVDFEFVVPARAVAVEELLPVLQGLSDWFAARAAARAAADGRPVSCRPGCGACCRQLVPVSAAEARRLARLVDAMPEPRQSRVRRRFEEALAALDAAGLVERMSEPQSAARPELGTDYFRQGVACPFLEDESCSIHADRPLACREYLVTSPACHCASPVTRKVETLSLDAEPSLALLKAERDSGWTPLVLALRLDSNRLAPSPERSGPDMLRHLVGRLPA